MQIGKIIKVLMSVAGIVLAWAGSGILAIAVSGSVLVGQYSAYATGSSLLLAAVPCIALLFSVRCAQFLGSVVLLAFALGALWLAFWSTLSLTQPRFFQAAAIAFAALVIFRVGLFLCKEKFAHGT